MVYMGSEVLEVIVHQGFKSLFFKSGVRGLNQKMLMQSIDCQYLIS